MVLLWVRDDRLEPKMIEALSHLRHLERKPPILILDHRREQHLRGEVSAETEDSVEVRNCWRRSPRQSYQTTLRWQNC
ncbi:MAG: hypothetical protein HC925_09495 [Coleofasciculaceae cyanobacterium SM2_3_26]|nr:hypothetical protein [Coleofasciculaceae cyanobacterium SM2_3_26]